MDAEARRRAEQLRYAASHGLHTKENWHELLDLLVADAVAQAVADHMAPRCTHPGGSLICMVCNLEEIDAAVAQVVKERDEEIAQHIAVLRDERAAHTESLKWAEEHEAQAVERCAQIAEGFESPFSQEFPAEAWRGRLQVVILQALLGAPKDGDDTQPERAIADAVFSFLQTGRDRMDELFKTGNASAAIRAEARRREPPPAQPEGISGSREQPDRHTRREQWRSN